jgi:hypothetical protein
MLKAANKQDEEIALDEINQAIKSYNTKITETQLK